MVSTAPPEAQQPFPVLPSQVDPKTEAYQRNLTQNLTIPRAPHEVFVRSSVNPS